MMTDFLLSLLPNLQALGALGYWLMFAISFAETFVIVGMFIPGTVMLIIMGGLSVHGYYNWQLLALFAGQYDLRSNSHQP